MGQRLLQNFQRLLVLCRNISVNPFKDKWKDGSYELVRKLRDAVGCVITKEAGSYGSCDRSRRKYKLPK